MIAAARIVREVKGYPGFVKILMAAVAAGFVAALARFVFGLGATTHLNDLYPWGLWIAFDVVTSVPLAAGAFVLGAIVHVFHIRKLEPLVRPAIVTGFLGYSLVCAGLLLDLGQPQRAWHVFVYPNFHSPMFEVSMCIMAYTTVAFLEFLSPVCERLGYRVPLRVLRNIELPLVILAASIATLHQSSIGTFFLIAAEKLHSLWYNPLLPLQFWISAVYTGMAVIMLETFMVHRYLGQPDETELLATLTKIIPWFLVAYLLIKCYALFFLRGAPPAASDLAAVGTEIAALSGTAVAAPPAPLFDRPGLSALFIVEIVAGVVVPLILFLQKRIRTDARLQLRAAALVVFGLMLNRFNVSIFGMIQADAAIYYPSLLESIVTLGVIAAHILFFYLVAAYFPIFEHHPERADTALPGSLHGVALERSPGKALTRS